MTDLVWALKLVVLERPFQMVILLDARDHELQGRSYKPLVPPIR
jgi:hypothetical protein